MTKRWAQLRYPSTPRFAIGDRARSVNRGELGSAGSAHGLCRMLQLASSTLPTGAFAYSHGLESVVELRWLKTETDCIEYLRTLECHVLGALEIPCLLRQLRGWRAGDWELVRRTSELLLASRESAELQAQDRQMARALWRVLEALKPGVCPSSWEPRTFAESFALACAGYSVPDGHAAVAYAYAWCEQHVNSLARLWPLGPIASQKVLDALLAEVPGIVEIASHVRDDDIGATCPRLGLACCAHETQYSRLFRS